MPYDVVIGRNESDKKLFGKKGLAYLGKTYVTMGNYTSLSNPVYLDVARTHVILVSGKRGCLTGDTLVFTDKGYKKINDFNEKEDKILSFNKDERNFEWETAELLEYDIFNEDILEIEFGNGRKIRLTKEHPLLITLGETLLSLLWMKADCLKKGDNFLSIGRSFENLVPIEIKEIRKISGIKKVYDLSVSKNHSFIANGIISHNSGKSYTLGVIAEALSGLGREEAQNIAPLIFDTMGIFWTMKFKNKKDELLLEDWNLGKSDVPVKVFAPFGYYQEYREKGIPVDAAFAIKISELEADDWIKLFELSFTDDVGVLIESVISKLKNVGENYNFKGIKDLILGKENTTQNIKNAAVSLFDAAETWKIFDEQKGLKIKDLIEAGKTSVIDLSMYTSVGSFNVRGLIIGLVCKRLFNERMNARRDEEIQAVQHGLDYLYFKPKREMPLVWIFIDEAHEFLPRVQDGKTPATDALVQLLREGRQPGISMVLATQQPGKIHTDALTQSDIVISHRVTAKPDVDALNEIMQSYLYESIKEKMNNLPKLPGSALILDDNSERIYPCRIRPRFTWHGGEAPTAVKVEKGGRV